MNVIPPDVNITFVALSLCNRLFFFFSEACLIEFHHFKQKHQMLSVICLLFITLL